MKRGTAVRHVAEMAADCGDINDRLGALASATRITSFWTFGTLLEPADEWPDKEQFPAHAAISVNLAEADVPWLSRPAELGWIAQMVRWDNRPVTVLWRSADTPVWNHFIRRPMLLWDQSAEMRSDALDALRGGVGMELHRLDPPTPIELKSRVEREAEVCLTVLRAATSTYEDKRWQRGDPSRYADALAEASVGYLDALDGIGQGAESQDQASRSSTPASPDST